MNLNLSKAIDEQGDASCRRVAGQALRELRKERGLTLALAGAPIGVERRNVAAWESGRAFPYIEVLCEHLKKMGHVLEPEPFDLLDMVRDRCNWRNAPFAHRHINRCSERMKLPTYLRICREVGVDAVIKPMPPAPMSVRR